MQGQRQQHITSRRRTRASHTTPRHRQHLNINVYAAPATLARRDGLRGSCSPVFEFCCPTHIFE
jgi:hypothetical protein